MTNHFEAKLYSFRRTKEGVVVSYVVHPDDVSAELATADLGTRYMIGFAEMGDDDKPKDGPVAQRTEQQTSNLKAEGSNPSGATKDRKPFASLPLSQQAALRCQDSSFRLYLGNRDRIFIGCDEKGAAHYVRNHCGVASRRDLDHQELAEARKDWLRLERDYQAWLTDQRFAEARR